MLTFLNTMDEIGMFEPGWSRVLAEITTSLQNAPTGPPNGDPTARLPGAALRRWIHIRDRRCSFPGCRAPAHRVDADHTIEHSRGGPTVDTHLAPACDHDHMLRHEGGWTVTQTTTRTRRLDQPARPQIRTPTPAATAPPARTPTRRRPRGHSRPDDPESTGRRAPALVGPAQLPRTRPRTRTRRTSGSNPDPGSRPSPTRKSPSELTPTRVHSAVPSQVESPDGTAPPSPRLLTDPR